MATKYLRGAGTGSWNTDASWSTTSSAGAANTTRPVNGDAVILDAGSTVNCVIDSASQACTSINCTGYTYDLSHAASCDLTVAGSLTFVAGMTYTPNSRTVSVSATSTITTGGKEFYGFTFANITATATLADNLTVNGTLSFFTGPSASLTWTINGNNIYAKETIATWDGRTVTGTTVLNISGTDQTWQTATGASSGNFGLSVTINCTSLTFTTLTLCILNYSGTWTHVAGTVDTATNSFMLVITGSTTITSNTMEFYGVKNNGNPKTITLNDDLTVNGSFYIVTAGGAGAITWNGHQVNAKGDIYWGDGHVISGTTDFYINGSSQTFTGAARSAGGITNNLIINCGTLNLVSFIPYYTGTITYTSGTINAGTSTLLILGSCTLNTNGIDWYNITASVNSTVVTLSSDLTCTNDFTSLGDSITVTFNNNNIYVEGDVNLTGATQSNNTLAGTSNFIISGSLDQNIKVRGSYGHTISMPVFVNKSGGTLTMVGSQFPLYAYCGFSNGFEIQNGNIDFGNTASNYPHWHFSKAGTSMTYNPAVGASISLTAGTSTIQIYAGNIDADFVSALGSFYCLYLGGIGSASTITLESDITCTNFKAHKSGTATYTTINEYTIYISGDFTIGLGGYDGFLDGTTTLNLNGSGADTFTCRGGYIDIIKNPIIIARTGGVLTFIGSQYPTNPTLQVANFTFTSGDVDLGNLSLYPTYSGTVTYTAGTITTTSARLVPATTTLNTSGISWTSITTFTTATTTLTSDLNCTGMFTISGSGMTSTVNTSNGSCINLTGNLVQTDAYTNTLAGSAAIKFNGTGNQTATGTASYTKIISCPVTVEKVTGTFTQVSRINYSHANGLVVLDPNYPAESDTSLGTTYGLDPVKTGTYKTERNSSFVCVV